MFCDVVLLFEKVVFGRRLQRNVLPLEEKGCPVCIHEVFTIKFFPFPRRYTKKLDRFSVFFSHKISRRRSLMAKLQPSKLVLSVRFRPPAPAEHWWLSGLTIEMEVAGMRFFLSIWVKNGLTSGYERFPIGIVGCVS